TRRGRGRGHQVEEAGESPAPAGERESHGCRKEVPVRAGRSVVAGDAGQGAGRVLRLQVQYHRPARSQVPQVPVVIPADGGRQLALGTLEAAGEEAVPVGVAAEDHADLVFAHVGVAGQGADGGLVFGRGSGERGQGGESDGDAGDGDADVHGGVSCRGYWVG